MNAGFDNRVVVLRKDFAYREATRPDLVADYAKAMHDFDIMAAAVVDSNIEFFTPSGGVNARAHQGQMIDRFTHVRIREHTHWLERVTRVALVRAYYDQFRQTMDSARTYRLSRRRDRDEDIPILYPEFHVELKMPSTSVVGFQELEQMRLAGLITQETMARYQAQAKNMPMEDMVTLQWPDNMPREVAAGAMSKPPKKKMAV
jgi:hypothetical protein